MTPIEVVEFWDYATNHFSKALPELVAPMRDARIILWTSDAFLRSQKCLCKPGSVRLHKFIEGPQRIAFIRQPEWFNRVHFIIHENGKGLRPVHAFKSGNLSCLAYWMCGDAVTSITFEGEDVEEGLVLAAIAIDQLTSLHIVENMLNFLESPFVDTETHQTSTRQQRRALERKGQLPPVVRTVTLRKASPSEPGEHVDREYSCRWEVTGHWRQTKHRLVYVRPHVKGPENKPLKPKLPTVYVAAR